MGSFLADSLFLKVLSEFNELKLTSIISKRLKILLSELNGI